MKGTELFSKLQSLKEQLSIIDENIDNQEVIAEKVKSLEERMEIKLNDLDAITKESNRVFIDACGKTYEVSKLTIQNCKYENQLAKEIEGKDGEVRIHIDIPKNYFKHLLNMVRYFDKNETQKDKYLIELEERRDNIVNFKKSVSMFFPDPKVINEIRIVKVKPSKTF
jgi:hypothetical protein